MAVKRTRKKLRLDTMGQVAASNPELRERADIAREQLARGTSEVEVRRDVVKWARNKGLVGTRAILPNLSRTVLRMPAARVIRDLAEDLISKAGSKKLRDVIDGWKIGWNQSTVAGIKGGVSGRRQLLERRTQQAARETVASM